MLSYFDTYLTSYIEIKNFLRFKFDVNDFGQTNMILRFKIF